MYEIINNVPLEIKEYNGQRVITFKDIDIIHDRPEGTAHRNFKKNRAYFIDGEDYFKVSADEIRLNKVMNISPKAQGEIILVTESGYMMLVKSFTDKLAWSVQRQLFKTYFRGRKIGNSYDEDIIIRLNEHEQKINELYVREEKDFKQITEDIKAITEDIKVMAKNIKDMTEDIRDIREDIKDIRKDMVMTSLEVVNTLIPCFGYINKKVKEIKKAVKKINQ